MKDTEAIEAIKDILAKLDCPGRVTAVLEFVAESMEHDRAMAELKLGAPELVGSYTIGATHTYHGNSFGGTMVRVDDAKQ